MPEPSDPVLFCIPGTGSKCLRRSARKLVSVTFLLFAAACMVCTLTYSAHASELTDEQLELLEEYRSESRGLRLSYADLRIEATLTRTGIYQPSASKNANGRTLSRVVLRRQGPEYLRVDEYEWDAQCKPTGAQSVLLVSPEGTLTASRPHSDAPFQRNGKKGGPLPAPVDLEYPAGSAPFTASSIDVDAFMLGKLEFLKSQEITELVSYVDDGRDLVAVAIRGVYRDDGGEFQARLDFHREMRWALKEATYGPADDSPHDTFSCSVIYSGMKDDIPLVLFADYRRQDGSTHQEVKREQYAVTALEFGLAPEDAFRQSSLGTVLEAPTEGSSSFAWALFGALASVMSVCVIVWHRRRARRS